MRCTSGTPPIWQVLDAVHCYEHVRPKCCMRDCDYTSCTFCPLVGSLEGPSRCRLLPYIGFQESVSVLSNTINISRWLPQIGFQEVVLVSLCARVHRELHFWLATCIHPPHDKTHIRSPLCIRSSTLLIVVHMHGHISLTQLLYYFH